MRLAAILVLALAGCGLSPIGGTPPAGTDDAGTPARDAYTAASDAGTVSGTVGGRRPFIGDVFSYDDTFDFQQHAVTVRSVKITSYPGACTMQQDNDSHLANSTYLKLIVGNQGSTPVTAQTYPVVLGIEYAPRTGPFALANWKVLDATCVRTFTTATGGSIVVTSLTAAGMAGTFTLTFPNNDALEGSFTAPSCAATAPTALGICK